MPGRIAVVDEDNRFVRWEERRTIHMERFVHRSIHVAVFDGQNRLLLQQRHRTKQTYPRFWDISCSGHVEESDYLEGPDDQLDEVYHQVAQREMDEELGVSPPLTFIGHFPPKDNVHYEQIHLFRASSQGPFTIQDDELEAIQCVTPAEFGAMRADPDVLLTHALLYFVDLFLDQNIWG